MGKFFSACYLCLWHAWKGVPISIHNYELTYVRKIEEPLSHV